MGKNTPKNNVIEQTSADRRLIDGFQKHGATVPSMTIAAVTLSVDDLMKALQSRIDALKAVTTTKASWQTAVKANHELREGTDPLVSRMKQTLLVIFAEQPAALVDFGLTERAKVNLPPEIRLAAAAKAKATRVARHTMGPKQKAKVKGVVPTPAAPSEPSPGT
jgi:type I site-specific restriction endonuclease